MENEEMDLAAFCKSLNDENLCQDIECRDCPIDKLFFRMKDGDFDFSIKKVEYKE